LEATLGGIVFEEISEVVSGHQVIERHHVNVFAQKPLLDDRSKHETTDSAKAVYSNAFHKL